MEQGHEPGYALTVADNSFHWYRTAAIRARRLYRSSEIGAIVLSAFVPLSIAIIPSNTIVPAILGSVVVVVTGLRSVFHWHENYLRFSRAREAVEAERRRYRSGIAPYSDTVARDGILIEAVTRIEQEEMGQWLQVAAQSRSDQAKQSI
ncbi:DUF4231 domain-containing protein [Pseudonocardia alaniniphila]|uniref:DUF4231 domain-containing protein n=1 Tax=Pseudonocardia alaniniphila TaxID=75291 RepID=A0ABS9TEU9_9PSEU|nr:DUF4231 domain-containing protein [Pseudonocardia alaniniphila]MCH6167047.1 DUF4231 domain-containing protein [Pseudonocardia alaniniphila]